MRALSVDNIRVGMKVGRTIYSTNGTALLTSGMVLNEYYVDRLRELGIMSLYIEDDNLGKIDVDDVISDQTRREAIEATKDVMGKIKAGAAVDAKKVTKVINDMIDDILSSPNLVVSLVDIRALNDLTFGHSVNVAVLSLIVGMALGLDQIALKNLAVGALLHDVGKTLLPEELLSKVAYLEPEESIEIKRHSYNGYEILRKIDGISLHSAHVALQHHEWINGEGYPRGLKGEEISQFGRIVAIANVYDALTTDRPDRIRYAPHHALEFIYSKTGIIFDPELVKVFRSSIAFFPVGNLVLLNTGDKGVVVKVYKDMPTRPVVRIVVDSRGNPVSPHFEVDLARHLTYYVAKNLGEQEL